MGEAEGEGGEGRGRERRERRHTCVKRPFSDRSFSSASIYKCGIFFSGRLGFALGDWVNATHLLLLELDLLHGVMRLVVQKQPKKQEVERLE